MKCWKMYQKYTSFFYFAVITKEKVWLAKVGKWKQILAKVTESS